MSPIFSFAHTVSDVLVQLLAPKWRRKKEKEDEEGDEVECTPVTAARSAQEKLGRLFKEEQTTVEFALVSCFFFYIFFLAER